MSKIYDMQVYKVTNLINNKIYIGQNKNDNNDYLGSGKKILLAIKKYGKKNFKKEIIEECSSLEELNQKEIYWIDFYNSTNKKIGYNIAPGGSGTSLKGKLNGMYGKKHSAAALDKMRKIKLGKKHSEETKMKMSLKRKGKQCGKDNPMYGKKPSPETLEKLRIASLGKTHSEKTKELLRQKATGKKHSEETRKKISQKIKGRIPWNKGLSKYEKNN